MLKSGFPIAFEQALLVPNKEEKTSILLNP